MISARDDSGVLEVFVTNLLVETASCEVADPVAFWRESLVRLVASREQRSLNAVSFDSIFDHALNVFDEREFRLPRLLEYENVLWLKGKGALYDGCTGLALPGSYVTRFPRQRQSPHCDLFRVELERPLNGYPFLSEALLVPFAYCGNFGHFATETVGGLWPLFSGALKGLPRLPVILPGCQPEEPLSRVLIEAIEDQGCLPVPEESLPDAVHMGRVCVPEPSMRLHAGSSRLCVQTASALANYFPRGDDSSDSAVKQERVFVSRSALQGSVRRVEGEQGLEEALRALGWFVFHPEKHSLSVQKKVYQEARVLAGFEGSAFHGLSFLGEVKSGPAVLFLGDDPSPDYFLQFKAQGLKGYFLRCTYPDQGSSEPMYLRLRHLSLDCLDLARFLDLLAASC
jgi:hypothetical protein